MRDIEEAEEFRHKYWLYTHSLSDIRICVILPAHEAMQSYEKFKYSLQFV